MRQEGSTMAPVQEGPKSALFTSLKLQGGSTFEQLPAASISAQMAGAVEHAPRGDCVAWGIPFDISAPIVLADQPVSVSFAPTLARQLVFAHTSDVRAAPPNASGFISPTRGRGQLGEHAADYVIVYADGSEECAAVRRR